MKTVIMAGGKGTRMASVNAAVPKPMIPILGKPVLEYALECLKRQGMTDVVLVIGHLGQIIREYFGDGSKRSPITGQPFGVNITYVIEETPLGTAGALFYLKDRITEDFLLLNGDIIFDVDLCRFADAHRENQADATIFTHPNSHPYDSGVIAADADGRVRQWLHKEDARKWYKNRVNAGLHLLSPAVLESFTELKKRDLDRDVLKPLISKGQLYVYDSPEYVKDMGTPQRYAAVTEEVRSGQPEKKNLKHRQRAVFLDRDGVLNEYVGFLTDIDQFRLLEGAAQAVRNINESGYLAIVVTNQPVIARGGVTIEELQEIHNKMETLLGEKGAYVDAVFYCPHHPHKGFAGERPEYKIPCSCRKPAPGMLYQAAEKYHIDLQQSWMVGDRESDLEAGRRAGCRTAKITGNPGDGYASLLEFVEGDEFHACS